jgi:hypothetical protein
LEENQRKKKKGVRSPSMFDQRLQWEAFWTKHAGRPDLRQHLRMSDDSFLRLLSLVRGKLEVDRQMGSRRGGAILPELCLMRVCNKLLVGHTRISIFSGMSVSLLYCVVWKCIDAINECDDLTVKYPTTLDKVKEAARGFQTTSTQGCIWNCVRVINGYHLQIQTPPKKTIGMCDPSSLVITRRKVLTCRPHAIIIVVSHSLVLRDLE